VLFLDSSVYQLSLPDFLKAHLLGLISRGTFEERQSHPLALPQTEGGSCWVGKPSPTAPPPAFGWVPHGSTHLLTNRKKRNLRCKRPRYAQAIINLKRKGFGSSINPTCFPTGRRDGVLG